jgi:hypothetical protein
MIGAVEHIGEAAALAGRVVELGAVLKRVDATGAQLIFAIPNDDYPSGALGSQ